MTVEAATYITGLNATYPAGTDAKSEGDDHIRLIKSVLQSTFPKLDAAVTASASQLNNVLATYGGTMAGDIAMGNNDIGGIKTAGFTAEYDAGNSGTAKTIDWNDVARQKLTLTGSVTLTFTAPPGTCALVLRILSGASPYSVAWPATVKWPNNTTPTVTTTAGRCDVISLFYNGTNYFGAISQNYTV